MKLTVFIEMTVHTEQEARGIIEQAKNAFKDNPIIRISATSSTAFGVSKEDGSITTD